MAKLSRAEFAEKCGMVKRALAVYIQRGKVVLISDDEIDDQDLKNRAFLEKYRRKADAKAQDRGEAVEPLPEPEKKIKKPITPLPDSPGDYDFPLTPANLETEKLIQQVEKLKNENEKLKLGNKKTIGNFIAIDPAKGILTALSEAIHTAWENEMKEFVMAEAAKQGWTKEEILEKKKKILDKVNLVRQRSVQDAKLGMRRLQDETASQRLRGEHG